MPDCFVRSGILELMVMVVNLVFDNHPFTYAGKMASIRMRAVSRSWRRSHIDGLRHSRDADRLTYRKLKNQTIPLSTPYAT